MSKEELSRLVNTAIDIMAKITSHRAELINIVIKVGSDEEKLGCVKTSLLEYRINLMKSSNTQEILVLLKWKSNPEDAKVLIEKALKMHEDHELLLLQIKDSYLGRDTRISKVNKISDLLM